MREGDGTIFGHPNRCLFFVILLLGLLSPGLLRLEIDGTTASMYPKNGKIFDWSREFKANFPSESSLIVVVRAENIFEPGTLRQLEEFAAGLEKIKVVKKCEHLFSLEFPKKRPGGFRFLPLIEEFPETGEESENLRREILSNPLLRGYLVNAEGTAAAFHPTLDKTVDVPDVQRYAAEVLGAYVDSAKERGIDAYIGGGPVIANAVTAHIWNDLFVLGPVGLVLMAASFLIFFRWRGALFFNLCTSCASAVATFGFMGWAGIAITPGVSVTMILIFVVGCTEDIHLVAEYFFWRKRGLSHAKALHCLNRAFFSALLLTSLTTALGFYMSAVSDIPASRDFAIACGTGILLNFLFTILIAPFFLRGEIPRLRRGSVFRGFFIGLLRFIIWTGTKRPVPTAIAAGAICLASIYGTSRVVIDNDFMNFFTERSPVLQSLKKLEEDFGGRASVMVTLDTQKRQGIWDPQAITRIAAFHDRLAESFERVTGLTSYLREYRYQIGESQDREKGVVPPPEPEQIEFIRAVFGNRFLGRYLDFDGSRTVVWIRSSISGSNDVRQAKEVIERAAAETLPGDWEIRVLGEPVATAAVTDSITSELFSSLFLMTVTVTAVLMLYFRSWMHGLLALVPNVLPVVATFGFMGWFGIPMGTGVFAVATAAFGIAVDDTIHLFIRFNEESERTPDSSFEKILRRCLVRELFPLIVASTTLIAGFAVFLLSDFKVHRETGLLFIVSIGTAMLSELFLTPLVLKGIDTRSGTRTARP
jgi:uncharacterized protein